MATYEWTTDKNGNQRYRRVGDPVVVERISEDNPPKVVTTARISAPRKKPAAKKPAAKVQAKPIAAPAAAPVVVAPAADDSDG